MQALRATEARGTLLGMTRRKALRGSLRYSYISRP